MLPLTTPWSHSREHSHPDVEDISQVCGHWSGQPALPGKPTPPPCGPTHTCPLLSHTCHRKPLLAASSCQSFQEFSKVSGICWEKQSEEEAPWLCYFLADFTPPRSSRDSWGRLDPVMVLGDDEQALRKTLLQPLGPSLQEAGPGSGSTLDRRPFLS